MMETFGIWMQIANPKNIVLVDDDLSFSPNGRVKPSKNIEEKIVRLDTNTLKKMTSNLQTMGI